MIRHYTHMTFVLLMIRYIIYEVFVNKCFCWSISSSKTIYTPIFIVKLALIYVIFLLKYYVIKRNMLKFIFIEEALALSITKKSQFLWLSLHGISIENFPSPHYIHDSKHSGILYHMLVCVCVSINLYNLIALILKRFGKIGLVCVILSWSINDHHASESNRIIIILR